MSDIFCIYSFNGIVWFELTWNSEERRCHIVAPIFNCNFESNYCTHLRSLIYKRLPEHLILALENSNYYLDGAHLRISMNEFEWHAFCCVRISSVYFSLLYFRCLPFAKLKSVIHEHGECDELVPSSYRTLCRIFYHNVSEMFDMCSSSL